MPAGYVMIMFLNNLIGSDCYGDLSKREKIGIASSIALGVDAVVAPMFTGGKTLHNLVVESAGMSLPEVVEHGLSLGEAAIAYVGQVYHAARNVQIISRKKVKT